MGLTQFDLSLKTSFQIISPSYFSYEDNRMNLLASILVENDASIMSLFSTVPVLYSTIQG